MGKDDFLTPKAIANRIKAKGLQKLRWYCQMCEKQCRDENGFKCHCSSESHQRQMILFADSPDKFINSYSTDFKKDFLNLLSRRFGTRRVGANTVYQEYISDRNHLHMNATIWNTLTDFVKYLGKEGICEVEETEKGWFIKWIDRRPETLARQEAFLKRERSERDEEEREQRQIQEQIERAKSQHNYTETVATELKRTNSEEKIKLDLSIKQTTKPGFKLGTGIKPTGGLKGLVKKNILKEAAKKISAEKKTSTGAGNSTSTTSTNNTSKAPKYDSYLDYLMKEDILGKKNKNNKKFSSSYKSNPSSTSRERNFENNENKISSQELRESKEKDRKRKERNEEDDHVEENVKKLKEISKSTNEEEEEEKEKRSSSRHHSHKSRSKSRSRSRSRSSSREHRHSSRHHRHHSHHH
jgi:hypothetical protein